jgi:hypothetical protein
MRQADRELGWMRAAVFRRPLALRGAEDCNRSIGNLVD